MRECERKFDSEYGDVKWGLIKSYTTLQVQIEMKKVEIS